MIIQLLIIFLVFLYGRIASSRSSVGTIEYKKNRRNLCIFAAILLILQSGLRNVAVGADTYAYLLRWERETAMTWGQLIANFTDVYSYGEGKDAGYLVFEKLCSYISTDFTVFLSIIACVFFIPLMRVVYKNTSTINHIVIAILVYEALFYSFFSITGCRQTVETGLCLLAFEEIKKRNLKLFLLYIGIGVFIHKSCLLFLPFYWIANIKKTYFLYYLALLSFPFMIEFGREFTLQLAILSGSENYLGYAEHEAKGAISFSLFYIVTISFLFFQYRNNRNFFNEHSYLVNAISLGLFFLPLTFVSAALMRIVQYFSVYLIVFFGYFKQDNIGVKSKIVYPVSIVILLYKVISTNATYGFFWEEMALGSNYM